MRKWTYLVAMLMLACATTTFTGCIDTDEPAGIEQLRGAKAELLKAKALVEAANVKKVEAEAALKNAEAKAKEAEAQATILRAEYEKAIAEAQSAAYIKEIEAQIALMQAQIDTEIARAEQIRQSAAQAERLALVELAKAQAQLVKEQQTALNPYITAYEAAVGEYDGKYLAYTAALKAYNDALTNLETNTNAEIEAKYDLEVAVEDAKANLAAAELAIESLTAELEEAKTLTPDELVAKRDAYEAEKESYNDSITLLTLELEKLPINNPEFKKLQELKKAVTEASTYTIAEYKNETAKGNEALNTALGTLPGYDNGVFSYAKNEAAVLEDADQDDEWDNSAEYDMVEAWLEALTTAYGTENDHINDSIDNTTNVWTKAVEEKDSLHQLAVAAWEILVDARYGEKTTAPTTKVDAAIKGYNDVYATVAAKVKAYNDGVAALKTLENEIGKAEFDASIKKALDAQYDAIYVQAGGDSISKYKATTLKEEWEQLETLISAGKLTSKLFDAVATDSLKTLVAAAANKGVEAYKKTAAHKADSTAAKTAMDAAFGKDANKTKVNAAVDVITKANTALVNVAKALKAEADTLKTEYLAYKGMLKADYGQLVSGKNLTKFDGTTAVGAEKYLNMSMANILKDMGADVTAYAPVQYKAGGDSIAYTSLANSANKFYSMVAKGSDIAAAEKTNLTAAELDVETVNAAWAAKSAAAWGYADRMLPVEEDVEDTNIGGTLKALMDAKAALAEYEAGMDIYETLATLIEEITAQKEALEAQVEEVEEGLTEQIAAVDEQKAVVKALKQEIKKAIKAIEAKQDIAEQFYIAYDNACTDFTGELLDQDAIDALIDDLEQQLEDAKAADFKSLELAILTAEEALANWDSVEQGDVKAAEATLANAKYEMEQAQAKMERAEARLTAALEALNNTTSAE